MSDLISTQEAVAKIVDTAIRKILSGEQKLTKEYEQSVKDAVKEIIDTARREAQPEIIHCKDCKHAIEDSLCGGYWCNGKAVTSYHFCGYAERRTDE